MGKRDRVSRKVYDMSTQEGIYCFFSEVFMSDGVMIIGEKNTFRI